MDILQELPMEQWPVLQEKLKSLWPLNLSGYYFLYTWRKYPSIREAYQCKVYCPHGNMDHGFVCTNIKRKNNQEVIFFSLTEDTSVLEEAIVQTKIIDWTGKISFDPLNSQAFKSLEKLKERMGFTITYLNRPTMFILERNTAPYALSFPDNTYVAPIKPELIPRINEVWPHRYTESLTFFSILVSCGLSYGLYSSTHELLAWVLFNEGHYLCHLYCEEVHRRKGYAQFILKWAVNEELKLGNDVYAYVVEGNMKSYALFEKVGFKIVDKAAFVTAEK